MADTQLYTLEAARAKAKDIIAALATSKLRFLKGPDFVPNQFTTRVTLIANEADFSGYTPGGYALAAWTGPGNAPGGGAQITSPLVNAVFDGTVDPPVMNSIVGWWIDDDTAVTPQNRLVGTFNPPRSMGGDGDVIDLVVQIVEGRNPLPPS